MSQQDALEQCYAEQLAAAREIEANGGRGSQTWLDDWVAEEILIREEELMIHDDDLRTALDAQFRKPLGSGHLSHGGALLRNVDRKVCACGEIEYSTAPNWRRCAACAKARTRELQAKWQRENRIKKQ